MLIDLVKKHLRHSSAFKFEVYLFSGACLLLLLSSIYMLTDANTPQNQRPSNNTEKLTTVTLQEHLHAEHASQGDIAPAYQENIPLQLAKLFSAMDTAGPDSVEHFEQAMQNYLNSIDGPVNELRQTFRNLPISARHAAWSSIYLATEIGTPEALDFLEEVALANIAASGDPHSTVPLNKTFAQTRSTDMTVKIQAAIGLAQLHDEGVSGSYRAVSKVLNRADTETSRMLAIELYSKEKLSPHFQRILQRKGIPTRFRHIKGAELAELRQAQPELSIAPERVNAANQANDHTLPPQETRL